MKIPQPLRFSYTGSIAKLFVMTCLFTVNQLSAQTVIEKNCAGRNKKLPITNFSTRII